ncbi:MAG: AI-2E family transporter [Anaerolineales bacterium]|nr:AI-2E family transporter [Anaerolineales bacterium]
MSYREFFRRILLVFVVLVFLVGAWFVRGTLVLAFLALVLAVALSVPVNWLHQRRWPRGAAIAVSIVIFLFITVLIFAVLLPTIFSELSKLLRAIPAAFSTFADLYEQFRISNEFIMNVLPPINDSATVDGLSTQLQGRLGPFLETGIPVILSGVGNVAVALVNLILVFFLSIFMLIDPLTYVKASLYLVPESYHHALMNLWNVLYETLTTWIRALLFSITITGFLVWFILGVILGMPNSMTVAVFAGVATLIPNIGFWLPLLPILIFNLAGDPALLLYTVPAYLIIQTFESNFITPSIVKAEMNIPAAGMMVCQIIAGIVFGPLGLLLAVPMVAVVVAVVRELYSYNGLGFRHKLFEVTADASGHLSLITVESEAGNEA